MQAASNLAFGLASASRLRLQKVCWPRACACNQRHARTMAIVKARLMDFSRSFPDEAVDEVGGHPETTCM